METDLSSDILLGRQEVEQSSEDL